MHVGNPADGPLLVPAIKRIAKRFGLVPAAVTSDRGYGDTQVEADLTELGVTTVAIPRKGKPGQARRDVEQQPRFHHLIKWRTGSEGRISYLKRRFGWVRRVHARLRLSAPRRTGRPLPALFQPQDASRGRGSH